jgi:hypothetical protein
MSNQSTTHETSKGAQTERRPTETPNSEQRASSSTLRDQLRGQSYDAQLQMLRPGGDAAVQLRGDGGDSAGVHEVAAEGVSGSGGKLPHADSIQAAFGKHDISGVQFHSGPRAQRANEALGAEAYASGNSVAGTSGMGLHTAAHEAAHIVQQRQGVSLSGGVGKTGDTYEQQADAVADAVVKGESAEPLLDGGGGGAGVQKKAVQRIGTPLDQELPEGAQEPAHGETKGKQRRFTPEQYMEMWEEEQGRKMTQAERETIERGCIGITAQNLNGGGNPLGSAEVLFGGFDQAHKWMKEKNAARDWLSNLPIVGKMFSNKRYVLFAKLFLSNQAEDPEARTKPNEDAYKPDPKTGKVDMEGYKYLPRVKEDMSGTYVNFDYGFWDESSQSFWHANHMRYKDPERNARDPMIVLQSTREKFAKGYIDFDRIVYGVAIAQNYDAGLAAMAHAGSE